MQKQTKTCNSGGCSRQAESPPAESLDVGLASLKSNSNLRGGGWVRKQGILVASAGAESANFSRLTYFSV